LNQPKADAQVVELVVDCPELTDQRIVSGDGMRRIFAASKAIGESELLALGCFSVRGHHIEQHLPNLERSESKEVGNSRWLRFVERLIQLESSLMHNAIYFMAVL
jgi:hypothetical protein